jgi:hypothetical protein
MMKHILVVIILVVCNTAFAQTNRCHTVQVHNMHLANHPSLQNNIDALKQKIDAYEVLHANDKPTRAISKIPVVVHVLHNGQNIGVGPNISVAQINSQIQALNEDFRLKNADSLPTNHPFYNLAGDAEIEFCLATLTPSNTPTTGIDRINIGVNSISVTNMESYQKAQTIWDSKKYLNIWVCNLTDTDPILGYASFPNEDPMLDGIAINYTYFGYVGNVSAPYDGGRTTVHEIGHYLNLFHIWGDQYCGSDFIADTPPASGENYGCPTFPLNVGGCSGGHPSGEMFMNFMDYADDACMKCFTKGQKTRMKSTLAVARAELLTSDKCSLWPVAINTTNNPASTYKVYPNPVISVAEIHNTSTDAFISVSVIGLDGKTIFTKTIANNNGLAMLPVNQLQAGVYVLQIGTTSGAAIQKIVKQ